MSSLQGITVAVSPSGVKYFCSTVLADSISQAISQMSLQDNTINVGDILVTQNSAETTWANNVVVKLKSGYLTSFDAKYSSVTQNENGEFTLQMIAENFKADYSWNETYKETTTTSRSGSSQNINDTYSYSVGFSKMTITVVFQFEYDNANSNWELTYKSSTATTSGVSPNIPSKSVVNDEAYSSCFSTQVSDSTKTALDTIDFSTPISKVIQPLFGSIPASGEITSDIIFDFPLGPSGLTFPDNSGIATGVTGEITYKNTAYSASTVPQLSLPSVPSQYHLNYYASDYTFNALMWAFYESGALVKTATTGNIPDPAVLNTSYYQNTQLQALFDAYPYKPMTADIKALQTPTVEFQQIYELTASSMASLQSTLPSADYNNLLGIEGAVFLTQSSFDAVLVDVLGADEAEQYKTTIEAAAKTIAAVVTQKNQVIMNVLDSGTVPVVTFDVSQTDVLQALVLGVSGTTQTIQFGFQIVPSLTTTTFISSTVSGINSGNFNTIWVTSLEPVFAEELANIGKAGVALPRIPGFNFQYEKAIISIEQGYLSVLADVQYITDNGVQYLLSKQLLDPAPSSAQ